MGFLSKLFGFDDPPPPPDYAAAARETAAGNLQAAETATMANRVNQNTPYGSLTYTKGLTDQDPWTSNVALSQTGQDLLDAANKSQLGLSQLQGGVLDQVKNTVGKPMDYSGVTPIRGSVGDVKPIAFNGSGVGTDIQTKLGDFGNIQSSLGDTGQVQAQLSGLNGGRGDISLAGVGGVDDRNIIDPNAAYQKRFQDATYNKQTQYLDPRFKDQEDAFKSQMANQGLVPGGEAYDKAYRNMSLGRNQAYSDASMNAITGGLDAQQSDFGMNLQSNQQRASNQAQRFGQSAAQTQAANDAARIQSGNAIAAGQFANDAQQQREMQAMSRAGLFNAAQESRFNQGMMGAQFGNDAQGMLRDQNMQDVGIHNAAQTQQFNQGLANANLANAANAQGMQNTTAMYNQPLNTLNAVMSGSQVQNPTFGTAPQQATTAGADILNATNQQYTAASNNVNAANTAKGNFWSGLADMAGTLGGAKIRKGG